MEEIEKVYIGNNDMATFKCPACNKTKTTNVSRYKSIKKAVRVKLNCPCGHSYTVLLERRKHIRKNLQLPGALVTLKDGKRGAMVITDLSRSGVHIKLNIKTDINVGDKLMLEFTLDDTQRSQITKEVIVRSIRDLDIGAEFISKDHYDKLGSYLLFNF